jgi:hypothetical protein
LSTLFAQTLFTQRERALIGAIAATASCVKAAKPAPSEQQPHCCFTDPRQPNNTNQNTAINEPGQPGLSPHSSSYCQQDTAAADEASAGSSTVAAELESAIFSALDADSSTDIFFHDPKTAALNHLLSQLATTELKVQCTLLRLGCSEQSGDGLYTSQLLQQLLATAGQQGLQAAAEARPEDCLMQLAAAVKQISCLLPRCGGV